MPYHTIQDETKRKATTQRNAGQYRGNPGEYNTTQHITEQTQDKTIHGKTIQRNTVQDNAMEYATRSYKTVQTKIHGHTGQFSTTNIIQ